MSDKPLILAVDDEPTNIEIIEEALENKYQLEFSESGEECLEKLNSLKPELILLDVNMPGIGGIDACNKIKNNAETAHIPVIFLSALGLPEDRMKGYKAGADDYIIKPFDTDELLAKINLTFASQQEKTLLQQGSTDAMSMAMTAMSQASEMGEVMQFTRDSHHCKTLNELATRLLQSFSQFELSATIRMTERREDLFFSTTDIVGDREIEAMEYAREGDRFIHFGKRTILNYNNLSVLIKNMPVQEIDKYGRINDILGMLVEGADARIVGINMLSSLVQLISTTREVLGDIELVRKDNEQKNAEILNDLVNSVDWAFINMDLSEEQEQYFKGLLNKAQKQSSALFEADFKMEKKIENLISSLSVN
ncbi:MAG: response regulator [Methylococcales bacterium]|nr:response regulator [Methylococcales bacterium]